MKTIGIAAFAGGAAHMPLAASTHTGSQGADAAPQGGLHYAHAHGRIKVVVLTDGALNFPPHPTFGGERVEAEAVKRVLRDHFRPTDAINAQLNLALIDDGKEVTLVDTGYGERGRNGTGRLTKSLAAAGYAPGDVDRVIISHAHPDHLFGATTLAGKPVFKNAEVLITEKEKAAWTKTEDELAAMREAGDGRVGMLETQKEIFDALGDRLRTIEMETKVADGIRTVDLHGHTPGHIGLMLESKGDSMLVLADTANHEILMTVEPDWPFGFDADPAQTAETRKAIFDKAAQDRLLCLGYHWSFPGLGYIGKSGEAYRYHPKAWAW